MAGAERPSIRNDGGSELDIGIRDTVSVAVCIGVSVAVGFFIQFAISDVIMSDLTIVYLTANKMPNKWVEYHLKHLVLAVGNHPVITVSRQPMSLGLGETKLLQTSDWGSWNTFLEWNKAAKIAKTPYVAIAEDDTLYHPWHFSKFRPQMDEVAYDMSRWTVLSWVKIPTFGMLRRLGGFTMICPRELMIAALDERERKHPHGCPRPGEIGREDTERRMRVTRRKHVEWWCDYPMVNLAHPDGLSPTYIGPTGWQRKLGEMKALEIPYWGRAEDIARVYNEGVKARCET